MLEEKKPRWRELCEQAAIEQDSDKLLKLVTEINQLLDPKSNENSKNAGG